MVLVGSLPEHSDFVRMLCNMVYIVSSFGAQDPLLVLDLCKKDGSIGTILNYRRDKDTVLGHYSVIINITSTHVILHDPFLGPYTRIAKSDLLEQLKPKGMDARFLVTL